MFQKQINTNAREINEQKDLATYVGSFDISFDNDL